MVVLRGLGLSLMYAELCVILTMHYFNNIIDHDE